jgi:hypothetical protein
MCPIYCSVYAANSGSKTFFMRGFNSLSAVEEILGEMKKFYIFYYQQR